MNIDETINRRIREYVNKNKKYYDEYEQYFLEGLTIEVLRKYYKYELPDIARQVLEEIGYYKIVNEESGYDAFIDVIDKQFGLEKNIVEVGGGIIPTLAKRISLKQKKGTITIYDPRLSNYYTENDKFILKKEKFKRNTNVDNKDLLMGFMPCAAAQQIIENATDNNLDFIIALCEGGPHGDEFDYFESDEEWVGSMIYLAQRGVEEKNMGEVKKLSFKKYGNQYPVIYNNRKQ